MTPQKPTGKPTSGSAKPNSAKPVPEPERLAKLGFVFEARRDRDGRVFHLADPELEGFVVEKAMINGVRQPDLEGPLGAPLTS